MGLGVSEVGADAHATIKHKSPALDKTQSQEWRERIISIQKLSQPTKRICGWLGPNKDCAQ